MQNYITPTWMVIPEQTAEAAGILAIGILRARRAKFAGSGSFSETGLDLSGESSVHLTNPSAGEEKR